ncbi:MAG: esterase [Lachnospiraceae bacterium]|nr:esterase [Lachnospiraceae bacterium]
MGSDDILLFGDTKSTTVLIQPVDDHDLSMIENEVLHIKKMSGDDFCLIAVRTGSWNDELSPWEAPPVFGKKGFGGGAAKTFEHIMTLTEDPSKKYIIGGYSLAGLFSLWAAYRTDVFYAVAAASPSVWFPLFSDFVKENKIKTKKVYLSLGDREEKTSNPVMSSVGSNIRDIYDHLKSTGTECILEWNSGNHFKDPDLRTAKAFAWAKCE